ncbi:MAG: prefoldin subunit alpha [Thermoplasmata archaeon]|jgi:prefoldin alpha subunit
MSASSPPPTEITEQQVQEDLARLDAYRSQLNALVQQHQYLAASRQDHLRARESLEGVDRAPPSAELLLPLGAETFVRGSIDRTSPVLLGVGSGIVVEMERPKVVELLADRLLRIDHAVRDLEGQMTSIDERIQLLSQRLDAIARASAAGPDVGGD